MTKERQNAWLMLTVASGVMLNPLNSSMISVALPSIQRDFHLSYDTVTWLISSFYLSSAIAQPVMGRIGDFVNMKKLFFAGLLLVAVSAVFAPIAPTFLALLILRLFQSVGSSSIFPSGMAIIHRSIKGNLGTVMAIISVCTSATAALGPTIGGFLVSWWDWPAVFTVNFPLILLSFAMGWFFLPTQDKSASTGIMPILRRLDIPGILLFVLSVIFCVWFLLSLGSGVHYFSGAAGFALLILFIVRELTVSEPFIDFRFFRTHPRLAVVNAQFIILNIYFYSIFFGFPTYFQSGLGLDPHHSGLLMLFTSGCTILVSPATGKYADRHGSIMPITVGGVLLIIGAVLITLFFPQAGIWGMGAMLSITGVAYGLLNVALQASMMRLSPPEMIGVSSGIFQMSRYIGAILSSVVLGLVFRSGIDAHHFRMLGVVMTVMGVTATMVSFSLIYLLKKHR